MSRDKCLFGVSKKVSGLLGFGVSIALILTACSAGTGEEGPLDAAGDSGTDKTEASESATTTSAQKSTDLRVALQQEPSNWNYLQNAQGQVDAALVPNVLEPLLEKTEDGSVQPLLAESFDVSDDGREYTFTLREARFHDGSELTADDAIFSLEAARKSELSTHFGLLSAVEAIEKVDDRTFTVTLSEPSRNFQDGMAGRPGLIIPEGSIEGIDTQPIGTGPWQFDEWSPGEELRLTRFDDYWGEQAFFETVTMPVIPDVEAQLNALLAGDVDVIPQALSSPDRLKTLEEEDGFALARQAGSEIYFVMLNGEDPAFEDERVRQAVAHAIDRQTIIDGAAGGFGEATCVLVAPPNVQWDSEYCPYPYDPDRARELLAEAGVEDLTLTLTGYTGGYFPTITEILTAQLGEVGITVQTEPVDLPTWVDLATQGDYQLTHIAGSLRLEDFGCPDGGFVHDCLTEVDELLAEADASVDEAEWADLRRQAAEMHAERGYLIPTYNSQLIVPMRDDLAGLDQFRNGSQFDLHGLHWTE